MISDQCWLIVANEPIVVETVAAVVVLVVVAAAAVDLLSSTRCCSVEQANCTNWSNHFRSWASVRGPLPDLPAPILLPYHLPLPRRFARSTALHCTVKLVFEGPADSKSIDDKSDDDVDERDDAPT